VSVIVPARDAADTIGRTLDALAHQDLDASYEVIVVDDGSTDATVERIRSAPLDVHLVRSAGAGAADSRNRGAAVATGEVLAFTDADCFPTRGWLKAGMRALASADLVQGRVDPEPGPLGPFDRSLWVTSQRGFYESANLFVDRNLFSRLGGFEAWIDHRGGRPFAEDTWFGWRAHRSGARLGFCEEALVHHAVFARGAREYIGERSRLQYFPAVAAKMPEFPDAALYRRHFLTRRSAAFDCAVLAAAGAVRRRSPLLLACALPYARIAAGHALRGGRRRAAGVLAADVAADAIGLAALVRGSMRWRYLIL
jgi:glycosyltransferase involved in cell wall biosynthesis